MKEKVVKGPRKPPKFVLAADICTCNIEDYPAWIMHNIDAITQLFAAHVISEIARGHKPPMPEEFEDFCKFMHSECLVVIAEQGVGATRH